jgi:hypothetical protein
MTGITGRPEKGKMARSPATFRQQDLTRALRGAAAAGLNIASVEIDKSGKIVIVPGSASDARCDGREGNEWDSV